MLYLLAGIICLLVAIWLKISRYKRGKELECAYYWEQEQSEQESLAEYHRELEALESELISLETQARLLERLTTVYRLDETNAQTASEIKQALAQEKALAAVYKRIASVKNKINNL